MNPEAFFYVGKQDSSSNLHYRNLMIFLRNVVATITVAKIQGFVDIVSLKL